MSTMKSASTSFAIAAKALKSIGRE